MLISSFCGIKPLIINKVNQLSKTEPSIKFKGLDADMYYRPSYRERHKKTLKDRLYGVFNLKEFTYKNLGIETKDDKCDCCQLMEYLVEKDPRLTERARLGIQMFLDDEESRKYAIEALRVFGKPEDVYDYGLKYFDEGRAAGLIMAFGKEKDEKIINKMKEVLNKPDSEIEPALKRQALHIIALKDKGNPETIELIKPYVDSPDEMPTKYTAKNRWTSGSAIEALGIAAEGMEYKERAKIVDIILKDSNINSWDSDVRDNSVKSLNKLVEKGDPNVNEVIDKVIPRINDDCQTQLYSIKLLGKIGQGNKNAEKALVDFITDRIPHQRYYLGDEDDEDVKTVIYLSLNTDMVNNAPINVSETALALTSLAEVSPDLFDNIVEKLETTKQEVMAKEKKRNLRRRKISVKDKGENNQSSKAPDKKVSEMTFDEKMKSIQKSIKVIGRLKQDAADIIVEAIDEVYPGE